jgi:CBS domain-containing protein
MHTHLSTLLNDKGHAVHSISPHESAYNCVVKLNQLQVGALLVMDGKKLLGLISERDIIRKLINCKCDPSDVIVKDLMTTQLITVKPETTVEEAIRLITEKRFRHLPVLKGKKLVGLISIGDLTRWIMLAQEQEISALTNYIQS